MMIRHISITAIACTISAMSIGQNNAIFQSGAGDGYAMGANTSTGNQVTLSVRVLLEGPWNAATQVMNDGLRSAGLIPLTEPYSGLGYPQAGFGGGETATAAVIAQTSPAIVDWVRIELRSAGAPSSVVATRQALLAANGSILSADASTTVQIAAPPGNYYVVVRHRNHLGVMTASPLPLSATSTTVDFRFGSVATFGIEPQKIIGTVRVLWAGDVNHDHVIKYVGADNDRDPMLVKVGSTAPNNTVSGQYAGEDVNMNGTVKYTGLGNDRDPILVNVGGSTPNSTRAEQVP